MRLLPVLAVLLASAGAAQADPMHLSGLAVPLIISGVPVTLTADADIDPEPAAGGMRADAKVVLDLADLQKHALDLARTIALPNDPCSVTVNHLDAASITPSGSAAQLRLEGNITGHLCHPPLKVDANSNLSIEGDVVVAVKDGGIRLALSGPVELSASSDLINAVIAAFKGPLEDSLGKAVSHALDQAEISTAIPALQGAPLTVTDASFYGEGERLMLRATVSASLSGDQLAALAGSP